MTRHPLGFVSFVQLLIWDPVKSLKLIEEGLPESSEAVTLMIISLLLSGKMVMFC